MKPGKNLNSFVTVLLVMILLVGMVTAAAAGTQDKEELYTDMGVEDSILTEEGGGNAEPPEEGGGTVVPPDEGGGDIEPPDENGGDIEPPDEGGGDMEPPEEGGGNVELPEEDGQDEEPPAEQEKPSEAEKPSGPEQDAQASSNTAEAAGNNEEERSVSDGAVREPSGNPYIIPRNIREAEYRLKDDNAILVGDYNQNGLDDLWVIQQTETESGMAELHVLDGESNYYTYLDRIELPLEADSSWTFMLGRQIQEVLPEEEILRYNLYAIHFGEKETTLIILDAETQYQEILQETVLPIVPQENRPWFGAADANEDGIPDLYVVNSLATESGYVEVGILDGASGFQTWIMQTETITETQDQEWSFGISDYDEGGKPDLYLIRVGEAEKIEVLILSAEEEFQEYLEEKQTHMDIPDTDTAFVVTEEAVNIYTVQTDTDNECAAVYLMAYRGDATITYGAYLEALRYEGLNYVWGGESLVGGVDCSGLVKVIYEKFDIHLAHYSMMQRYAGIEVKRSEMEVGDLICYNGHIGFYAGNNQLYSAWDTRAGVCFKPAYYQPILSIRRLGTK